MDYQPNGQRDERRRRVLFDQSVVVGDDGDGLQESGPGGATAKARYSRAARALRQPPITALIPKRTFVWFVLLGAGLAVILGLEALYCHLSVFHPGLPQWRVLRPTAAGSIASWFSSSLLLIGSAACLMTFLLRRHRLDDYRGGYRYWLWAAVVLVVASIDAATGVHDLSREVFGRNGAIWSQTGWVLAVTGLLFFLGGEVLVCRSAAASLTLALVGYVAAVSFQFGWLPGADQPFGVVLQSTVLMLSHLALVVALGRYTRFVFLDAHGLTSRKANARAERVVKKRRRRSSRKKLAEEATDEQQPALVTAAKKRSARKRTDLDSAKKAPGKHAEQAEEEPVAKPAAKKRKAAPATKKVALEVAEETRISDDEDVESRPLSKSERRRLRKQKRRQQREAA